MKDTRLRIERKKERRDELETELKAIVSVYLTQDDETSNLSS